MKRFSFGNRLTPILLLACVLLGIIVAVEWYTLSRQDGIANGTQVAQPPAANDMQPNRNTYQAPDFAAFSEILERPLFTKGRTPPEEPSVDQATASVGRQTQPKLRLEGIALTPVAKIAVIRDTTSNTLLRLAEGAKHQGWLVERIQATGATLKRGEQTHELTLELDQKPPRRPPSAARKTRKKKK